MLIKIISNLLGFFKNKLVIYRKFSNRKALNFLFNFPKIINKNVKSFLYYS